MAFFTSPQRRHGTRLVLAAVGSAAVSLAVLMAACIVADPPAELPSPPNLPPRIVQGSVYPPPSRVIPALPAEFLVPVELVDPSQTFRWEVFVDFDQARNELPTSNGTVTPDQTALDAGKRLVPFSLDSKSSSLDPSSCHVIEFLVAVTFEQAYPHTPTDPPGGGRRVSFRRRPRRSSSSRHGRQRLDAPADSSRARAAEGRPPRGGGDRPRLSASGPGAAPPRERRSLVDVTQRDFTASSRTRRSRRRRTGILVSSVE